MAKLQSWDREGFGADVRRLLQVNRTECLRVSSGRRYSPAPVVICSMPRAGSTLLEQMIGAHPEVSATGESGLATRACHDTVRRRQLPDPLFAAWFAQPEAEEIFGDAFAALRQHASAYHIRTQWFTDKSANNDLLAGLWLMAYPDARIIHCRRHPLDVCLSCYQAYFSAGVAFSNRLDWLARRYEIHEQLMGHWKKLFPDRCLTISYENLVREPAREIEAILNFIGLDWDDNCLRFADAGQAVRSASNWQVRQPLHTTSINRWHAYREQLAEIMHLADCPQAR